MITKFEVLLETSGATSLSRVDPRVYVVLDVKCPGSGESGWNMWANLSRMRRGEIKFVVASRHDFDWARNFVSGLAAPPWNLVCFSPVTPGLDPAELAAWMVETRTPGRMQVQLHKVLWGDRHGV